MDPAWKEPLLAPTGAATAGPSPPPREIEPDASSVKLDANPLLAHVHDSALRDDVMTARPAAAAGAANGGGDDAASALLSNGGSASDDAGTGAGAVTAVAAPSEPKAPFMRRAERCVRTFERRKTKKLRRSEWGWCSLAFPNEEQERVFGCQSTDTCCTEGAAGAAEAAGMQRLASGRCSALTCCCWCVSLCWLALLPIRPGYFAQLRERNMRGSMLLLVFSYMLYATIEWRDTDSYALTISRGVYVFCILLLFCWSYARPRKFRLWLQEWVLAACAFTAINILVEALLLRAVYSPFVVIILLLFLLSSSVVVRLRFAYTSALCWGTLVLYDLICVVHFRGGDDFVSPKDGHNAVIKWLVWYNFVLVFAILVVQKIAHRVEVQTRYEFLTTALWTERRAKERRRKRQEQARATLAAQYNAGANALLAPPAGASGRAVGDDEAKQQTLQLPAVSPLLLPRASPSTAPPPSITFGDAATAAVQQQQQQLQQSAPEWLDSDSEWDEDSSSDEEEDALMALDADPDGGLGGLVDSSTIERLNASLQRTLHDLLFTPASARQSRAIIEEEEEQAHVQAMQRSASRMHVAASASASASPPGPSATAGALSNQTRALSPSRTASPRRYAATLSGPLPSAADRDRSLPVSPSLRASASGRPSRRGSHDAGEGGEPPVPVDQMSRITKALADSGVGDMRSFLRLLASKPDQQRSRTTFALCTADELPSFFLGYPGILTGYRVNFSAQLCLKSLFRWHNETLNVWTEFVPMLFCFVAFWWVMYADTVLLAASPTDRAFVAVGLVGSLVLRPLCSGLAHLMYPQNERSYVLWWGVDYVSICVSIFCTCAVFGRFTFYCLPDQQSFFYVSLVGLFLSTVVSVLFVSSNGVRTGSFLLFVLFATGVPFWYSLANKWAGGAANDAPSHYLLLWVASLGCFLVGLIFKSSGFPETMACSCVRPGAFDIVGYSHCWWHICINVGNALVYPIWRTYLEFRQDTHC